ncbi:hypothetical protein OCAR_5816 [Afipia carboxidovorans OM5]|nr:hypothetical protein OCAR_5816 [Afipia carboxidovorans OM5]
MHLILRAFVEMNYPKSLGREEKLYIFGALVTPMIEMT